MVYALHVKGKWDCKTVSTALHELLGVVIVTTFVIAFCQLEQEIENKMEQKEMECRLEQYK